MTKANVGDKIRVITYADRRAVGRVGTVLTAYSDGSVYVDLGDVMPFYPCVDPHEYEMVRTDDVIKLAFVGKMRSGKDTAATRLATQHGFTMLAFGTALKASAHDIFPDVLRTPKPRALYQFMNVMRDFQPDVWIRHVERSVEYALDRKSTTGIVITDARQANEIAWCRANGFTIVRVTAPDDVRIARAQSVGDVFDVGSLEHPTETGTDGFEAEYTISNDGSYADLVERVDALMAEIKEAI